MAELTGEASDLSPLASSDVMLPLPPPTERPSARRPRTNVLALGTKTSAKICKLEDYSFHGYNPDGNDYNFAQNGSVCLGSTHMPRQGLLRILAWMCDNAFDAQNAALLPYIQFSGTGKIPKPLIDVPVSRLRSKGSLIPRMPQLLGVTGAKLASTARLATPSYIPHFGTYIQSCADNQTVCTMKIHGHEPLPVDIDPGSTCVCLPREALLVADNPVCLEASAPLPKNKPADASSQRQGALPAALPGAQSPDTEPEGVQTTANFPGGHKRARSVIKEVQSLHVTVSMIPSSSGSVQSIAKEPPLLLSRSALTSQKLTVTQSVKTADEDKERSSSNLPDPSHAWDLAKEFIHATRPTAASHSVSALDQTRRVPVLPAVCGIPNPGSSKMDRMAWDVRVDSQDDSSRDDPTICSSTSSQVGCAASDVPSNVLESRHNTVAFQAICTVSNAITRLQVHCLQYAQAVAHAPPINTTEACTTLVGALQGLTASLANLQAHDSTFAAVIGAAHDNSQTCAPSFATPPPAKIGSSSDNALTSSEPGHSDGHANDPSIGIGLCNGDVHLPSCMSQTECGSELGCAVRYASQTSRSTRQGQDEVNADEVERCAARTSVVQCSEVRNVVHNAAHGSGQDFLAANLHGALSEASGLKRKPTITIQDNPTTALLPGRDLELIACTPGTTTTSVTGVTTEPSRAATIAQRCLLSRRGDRAAMLSQRVETRITSDVLDYKLATTCTGPSLQELWSRNSLRDCGMFTCAVPIDSFTHTCESDHRTMAKSDPGRSTSQIHEPLTHSTGWTAAQSGEPLIQSAGWAVTQSGDRAMLAEVGQSKGSASGKSTLNRKVASSHINLRSVGGLVGDVMQSPREESPDVTDKTRWWLRAFRCS